jgi:hypothetical protein
VGTLTAIAAVLASLWTEWRQLEIAELRFLRTDSARLALIGLVALAIATLVLRSTIGRRSTQQRVGLPALLGSLRTPSFAFVRHLPLVLLVAGAAAFGLAALLWALRISDGAACHAVPPWWSPPVSTPRHAARRQDRR